MGNRVLVREQVESQRPNPDRTPSMKARQILPCQKIFTAVHTLRLSTPYKRVHSPHFSWLHTPSIHPGLRTTGCKRTYRILQRSCTAFDRAYPAIPLHSRFIGTTSMAQPVGLDQLSSLVEGLSLDSIAQLYPSAHPEINPLDFYRAHLSNVLATISGVATATIYPAVNWTSGLDKGDFIVAVPALRIKGTKPDILAAEWAEKVRVSASPVCVICQLHKLTHHSFLKRILFLRNPLLAALSCRFSSEDNHYRMRSSREFASLARNMVRYWLIF